MFDTENSFCAGSVRDSQKDCGGTDSRRKPQAKQDQPSEEETLREDVQEMARQSIGEHRPRFPEGVIN